VVQSSAGGPAAGREADAEPPTASCASAWSATAIVRRLKLSHSFGRGRCSTGLQLIR
jgi:hypothetical protein